MKERKGEMRERGGGGGGCINMFRMEINARPVSVSALSQTLKIVLKLPGQKERSRDGGKVVCQKGGGRRDGLATTQSVCLETKLLPSLTRFKNTRQHIGRA